MRQRCLCCVVGIDGGVQVVNGWFGEGRVRFLSAPRPSQNNVINQFINQFQSMLLPVLFLSPHTSWSGTCMQRHGVVDMKVYVLGRGIAYPESSLKERINPDGPPPRLNARLTRRAIQIDIRISSNT
jgi:hypothetical protein